MRTFLRLEMTLPESDESDLAVAGVDDGFARGGDCVQERLGDDVCGGVHSGA